MEQLANYAHSTLNGALTNSTTSVVVADGSVFPTTGNFHLIVDDEILLCTSRSSNTLTVTRAAENTIARSHESLTTIRLVLTAESLKQWMADNCLQSTYASRPSPTTDGRMFFATDNNFVERDNGSSYDTFGVYYKFTAPPVTGWTLVNGIAATAASHGYMQLDSTPTPTTNVHIYKRSAPSTPYSIEMFFNFDYIGKNGFDCGFCWRESSSGKLATVGWRTISNGCRFVVGKWSSVTVFDSEYKSVPSYYMVSSLGGIWVKVTRDSTNRQVYVSGDGWNWCLFHTTTTSDYLTPNEVGLFLNVEDSAGLQNGYLYMFNWKQY